MLEALDALLPWEAVRVRDPEADLPPGVAGAYALLLALDRPVDFAWRGGAARIGPGVFVYAGSAHGAGGMRARLARHFRADKRPHWHIDRLSVAAASLAALALPQGDECAIIAALLGQAGFTPPLPGFGSSDCRCCPSHLLSWNAVSR